MNARECARLRAAVAALLFPRRVYPAVCVEPRPRPAGDTEQLRVQRRPGEHDYQLCVAN